MSYVAIGTAFAGAGNDLFGKFLSYRNTIQARLQDKYNPSSPFGLNSDDVLIPAFLAAYAGRSVDGVSLSAMPNFWSFLPNWQVSCNSLMRIPWFQEKFKSFYLSHSMWRRILPVFPENMYH